MKVTVELDLDDETDLLRFQMMEKADSIYFALRSFDKDYRVEQDAKDYLFETLDEQKDGLIDLFYEDLPPILT